jgi:hypothetical protein
MLFLYGSRDVLFQPMDDGQNSSHNAQLSILLYCMGLAPQFLVMQYKCLLDIVYLSLTPLHVGM